MALTNAQSIYEYMTSLPAPSGWQTPQTLKNSYARALNAQELYRDETENALRAYAAAPELTKSGEYKALLDLYNRAYDTHAAHAAAQTRQAAKRATAAYGDTYVNPATEQAYSAHLAQKSAAVPQLMAVAAKAGKARADAAARGVEAMSAQRKLHAGALQSLWQSQFKGIAHEADSARKAYQTLVGALQNLYQHQYALEHPAVSSSAGRSSTSRSSRSSSKSNSNQTQTAPTYEDNMSIYQKALQTIRSYGGAGLMRPEEFLRRQTSYKTYADYAAAMVKQAKR